ncbi:MAG: hypothetical protein PHO02_03145 [Candidatus Nanoarchaeia archaeon]|nr:hypothetical protein [Candidatus Nanoarchaeia archaeon]
MEAVCIKMDTRIMEEMESCIEEENYSTKTEFIREAIREKIKAIKKEHALKMLEANLGAAKVRVSDKRHAEIREQVGREYAKKYGIELD